jgi:hypothetical protein
MSLLDHPISQPSLDISPIWTPVITAKSESYNAVQCRLSGIFFLCLYNTENFSPVMTFILIVLGLKASYVCF